MRMLMQISLPPEPFNSYVRDGSAGERIQAILEDAKPEAVYFSTIHDGRGGVIVVDVADPSDVPRLAEPWFLQFEADLNFSVAMTPDDLARAGLEALGKKWG